MGAAVSLSSGYHPKSNSQAERANQNLENVLRCVAAQHPASWSLHLPWIEYLCKCTATGMSQFTACFGYQPSLFPEQEMDVRVSSMRDHLHCIREVWRNVRAALTRTARRKKMFADYHLSPAPKYCPGQIVWLSSQDLPLQVGSRKRGGATYTAKTSCPAHIDQTLFLSQLIVQAEAAGINEGEGQGDTCARSLTHTLCPWLN